MVSLYYPEVQFLQINIYILIYWTMGSICKMILIAANVKKYQNILVLSMV